MILPKDMKHKISKDHLMTETEWRNLGVQQSPGWIHYMIHQPGMIINSYSVVIQCHSVVNIYCRKYIIYSAEYILYLYLYIFCQLCHTGNKGKEKEEHSIAFALSFLFWKCEYVYYLCCKHYKNFLLILLLLVYLYICLQKFS